MRFHTEALFMLWFAKLGISTGECYVFFLTEVICEIQLVQLFWSKKREGSSCYFECSPLQNFSLVFSISYHTFLSCRILLPKGDIGVVVLFLCCMAWKLFFRLLLRFAVCSFLFLGVELIKKLKTLIYVVKLSFNFHLVFDKRFWWLLYALFLLPRNGF